MTRTNDGFCVKLEAMAMEKILQLADEALDKEHKELTCLHLVAGAGPPPSDEYINGLGGEVVLTEYHPGFFKKYHKLMIKMESLIRRRGSIPCNQVEAGDLLALLVKGLIGQLEHSPWPWRPA